jgi:hypothetical protein
LSTEKRGALGIVVNRRCWLLRRTSNVSETEHEMLESKESFERVEIEITNKQTNKTGCVILYVRLILTVTLKHEYFRLLFFR